MKVSVFGMGYVGCVNSACLCKSGHTVIAVDVKQSKVDLMNRGTPTIVEEGIEALVKDAVDKGLLSGTTSEFEAVRNSDVSLICVGTPNRADGMLDLKYIFACAKSIGIALKEKESFHSVVIRSTVAPGTNEQVGEIIEQASGKTRGEGFDVLSNPEFLREGSAVNDYFNPPVTVLGAIDGSASVAVMEELYSDLPSELVVVSVKAAEMIKYVSNSWHALKIVFANEVGNICKELGVDSHQVMELFCKDRQLNISNAYLKSGYAYGGSCLPKDLLGLVSLGQSQGIESSMLASISESNDSQVNRAYDLVLQFAPRRIAFLGISFKEGTDDLRFSPNLKLAQMLEAKGISIKIHDENVYATIQGGINDLEVRNSAGDLYSVISDDLDEVLDGAELVVVAVKNSAYVNVLDIEYIPVVDLVRLDKKKVSEGNYHGLCW